MQKKKYIIVNNAYREKLIVDSITPTVTKERYQYRQGQIGLIHPDVVNFYNNFNANIKKHCSLSNDSPIENILNILSRGFTQQSTSGIVELYKHQESNIPIVTYNERRKEYLLINLVEGEFKTIHKNLNKTLESFGEQAKYLKAFDILKPENIGSIVMEVAQKEISDEYIKHQLEHLKIMNSLGRKGVVNNSMIRGH